MRLRGGYAANDHRQDLNPGSLCSGLCLFGAPGNNIVPAMMENHSLVAESIVLNGKLDL